MMTDTVVFTPKSAKQLRKHYERAVKRGMEEFPFEGRAYVTAYAKYLLEFLERQFRDVS